MRRTSTFLFAAAILMLSTQLVAAQCSRCDDGCPSCGVPTATCCSAPACQAAGRCCGGPRCVGKAEMVDVEKDCFEIECEQICVPAVRFPWEHGGNKLTLFTLFQHCKKGCGRSGCDVSGCDGGCASAPGCGCASTTGCSQCVPPKCGRVITVRNLKKESYTTQVCEYSMEVVDGCGGGGCADAGCTSCAKAGKPVNSLPHNSGNARHRVTVAESRPQSLQQETAGSLNKKLHFVGHKTLQTFQRIAGKK